MGNLPTFLTEENVKKIVEKMGSLKSFNLVKDFVNNVPKSRVRTQHFYFVVGLTSFIGVLFLRVQ